MSKGLGRKVLGVYVTLFSKRGEAVKHELSTFGLVLLAVFVH